MSYRFHFCDPIASFAEGSAGQGQQRILDASGRARLGPDVWALGKRAYDMLRSEDGSPLTLAELRSYSEEPNPFLDGLLDEIRASAASGLIVAIGAGTNQPLEFPDQWREADWAWRVLLMAKFLRAWEEANPKASVREFDRSLSEGVDAYMLVAVLHLLDDATLSSLDKDTKAVTRDVLDAAWLLEQVESSDRIEKAGKVHAARLDSKRASERAKQRHAMSPQAKAREFVQQCWRAWRLKPAQYPTTAAFARGMLDAQPEVLRSQAVIAKWVREWDREDKLADGGKLE